MPERVPVGRSISNLLNGQWAITCFDTFEVSDDDEDLSLKFDKQPQRVKSEQVNLRAANDIDIEDVFECFNDCEEVPDDNEAEGKHDLPHIGKQ